MMALLGWRVWAALALMAVLTASHFTVYRKGINHERTANLAAKAEADHEARRQETLRTSRVAEAVVSSAARQTGLRTDAVGSAGALQRLRDEFSASKRVSEESTTAANQRAATAEQLFLESATALRGLAETCDRHASDVRLLLDSWPK